MRQVLEMAKGGVLMIDEAYLLNGKHENDPGKLVVQLLKTSRLSRCPARKQESVFDDATTVLITRTSINRKRACFHCEHALFFYVVIA